MAFLTRVYTVSGKRCQHILPLTLPNAEQFSKFLQQQTCRFLAIPPHLKRVATLPCEILMSENSNNLKRVNTIHHNVV